MSELHLEVRAKGFMFVPRAVLPVSMGMAAGHQLA